MNFRHEYKHYINQCDYLTLKSRLQVIAKPDKHVQSDGTYFIRSLYFDNYNDKALREKIDGVNQREKFRIRFYNMDTSYILLEKKSKINGLCSKQSTRLSKELTESILSGSFHFADNSNDELLLELTAKMKYQLLRPKTIVDYIREPYVYTAGNVRITFDSQIKTGMYNQSIFSDSPTVPANEQNITILEVKYDEFLPEVIGMIVQLGNRSNTAFSKYAAARIYG